VQDNNETDGAVQLFESVPCPDVNITCPTALTVNPSIFTYDRTLQARLINIGNVTITSTGFQGLLRVVGYHNGTIRLCVNQPDIDFFNFYLPQYGEVQVPLWLVFQPETHWETYNGNFTLVLTVCGTHRIPLTITGISITVCCNGAYVVNSDTATFTWNLTGGSLVYLTAEPELPSGWTYTVDPPIGTFFETPHLVTVNITAPPDAKEGDMARVTLRAYKNSTGAMIWQFVYFATTDNKPPTIESVKTPTFSPDGYLLFNATAQDHSGIAQMLLHYSVNGGPWENLTMQWASGDTFNSTQYTAQGFFGTEPKTIQYYVSATDWLGNQTMTDTKTVNIANDIKMTEISIDKTVAFEGSSVTLTMIITNRGTLPLSFSNIAIYANSTLISTLPLYDLQNGTSATLKFNLTLPRGHYTVAAFAACIPDEIDTSNNGGVCMITILGGVGGGGGCRMPYMN
jgi:hypothetical protein